MSAGAAQALERVRLYGDAELGQSAGTVSAPKRGVYHSYARIPREPWSAVDPDELRASGEPWDARRSVAVVALPPEILAAIRRLDLGGLTAEATRLQIETRIGQGAFDGPLALAERFCYPGSEVKRLGWSVQLVTSPTMTTDSKSGHKPGIHVDSWDAAPLHDRGRSRNRLCMNLGEAPRYFLFVDLTLTGVWQLLGRPDIDVGFGLGNLLFTRHPEYPVTRVRVDPGCAYIAPTENLLHDGMGPTGRVDVCYTLLGQFQPN